MEIAGSVIVITGGGSGIGAGLGRRFIAEGAAAVVLADRTSGAAAAVAAELGERASAVEVDVTDEAAVNELVAGVLAEHGRIDLFCSNAGIPTGVGLESGPAADQAWQDAWQVHVLAQLYAARAVVPAMIEAGGGYLLNTASAAGLLSSPGDAPYSVTKHASVALAEWLAYQYRDRNIGVSVLCPMGVDTPLLMDGLRSGVPAAKAVAASAEVIGVDEVAEAVVQALRAGTFLILPHPQVGRFWAGKAADIDRWLAGMAQLAGAAGTTAQPSVRPARRASRINRRSAAMKRENSNMAGVQERVALVTGGAQGIGAAIAARLAADGAHVAVLDLDEGAAARSAAGLGGSGKAIGIGADVSKPDQVQAAVDRVVQELGGLHILVNNAGVLRDNLLFKMTEDDWDLVMNVHLKGAFLCSRAAQKHMVEAKYGRILNMSSTSALGNRGQANYSTAKAGLQGLTKTLAIELGPFGVTVNAIAPGFIETAMTKATAERVGSNIDDMRAAVAAAVPVRRGGVPEDIANTAAFFLGEESGYVTGQVIYVDGGRGLL